jgi:hypothetical protein
MAPPNALSGAIESERQRSPSAYFELSNSTITSLGEDIRLEGTSASSGNHHWSVTELVAGVVGCYPVAATDVGVDEAAELQRDIRLRTAAHAFRCALRSGRGIMQLFFS